MTDDVILKREYKQANIIDEVMKTSKLVEKELEAFTGPKLTLEFTLSRELEACRRAVSNGRSTRRCTTPRQPLMPINRNVPLVAPSSSCPCFSQRSSIIQSCVERYTSSR